MTLCSQNTHATELRYTLKMGLERGLQQLASLADLLAKEADVASFAWRVTSTLFLLKFMTPLQLYCLMAYRG